MDYAKLRGGEVLTGTAGRDGGERSRSLRLQGLLVGYPQKSGQRNTKSFFRQPMRFVPDPCFGIPSSLDVRLIRGENGSIFSTRSEFIQQGI